jgi:hypothetical protein
MTPVGIPDQLGDNIAAAGVLGLWVTQREIGKMPDFGGAYVLALRLGPVRAHAGAARRISL